jgi:hypothetical protein
MPKHFGHALNKREPTECTCIHDKLHMAGEFSALVPSPRQVHRLRLESHSLLPIYTWVWYLSLWKYQDPQKYSKDTIIKSGKLYLELAESEMRRS